VQIQCKRCQKVSEIIWKVTGFGLEKTTIEAHCPNCKSPFTIFIQYPKVDSLKDLNKKGKPKIKTEFSDTNYIG